MIRIFKNIVMNEELAKVWAVSWSAFIISFQDIDSILRLLLLVASIAYTALKLFKLMKDDQTHDNE